MDRPIDAGRVIRRVFEIYFEQAPVLMPAAATVFVFSGLLSIVLVSASSGLRLLTVFISLLAGSLFTAMIVELVSDVRDGKRDAKARELVRTVTPVLGQVILVGVVVAAGVLVGFILFIVPGLVLLTMWCVAVPVIVIERPPGLQALARSRELVRGNGWRVFGIILALDVIVAFIVGAIDYVAETGGTGAGIAVTVVLGVLSAPIPALAAAVLYFELATA
jgi:hypothetical protein